MAGDWGAEVSWVCGWSEKGMHPHRGWLVEAGGGVTKVELG